MISSFYDFSWISEIARLQIEAILVSQFKPHNDINYLYCFG